MGLNFFSKPIRKASKIEFDSDIESPTTPEESESEIEDDEDDQEDEEAKQTRSGRKDTHRATPNKNNSKVRCPNAFDFRY